MTRNLCVNISIGMLVNLVSAERKLWMVKKDVNGIIPLSVENGWKMGIQTLAVKLEKIVVNIMSESVIPPSKIKLVISLEHQISVELDIM